MDGTWNSGNLRFWKNVQVQFLKFSQQIVFWKCPPWCFAFPEKHGFGKSRNSQNPNPFKQPLSWMFDINGKMDLETLIWTPSISAQLPETSVLLWAKSFENLVFDLNPNGAKSQISRRRWCRTNSQIPPDPSPNAPRDEIRRKDPCCDFQVCLTWDFEMHLNLPNLRLWIALIQALCPGTEVYVIDVFLNSGHHFFFLWRSSNLELTV